MQKHLRIILGKSWILGYQFQNKSLGQGPRSRVRWVGYIPPTFLQQPLFRHLARLLFGPLRAPYTVFHFGLHVYTIFHTIYSMIRITILGGYVFYCFLSMLRHGFEQYRNFYIWRHISNGTPSYPRFWCKHFTKIRNQIVRKLILIRGSNINHDEVVQSRE